eukprot:3313590-Pyramimonas_sp.AAC.1
MSGRAVASAAPCACVFSLGLYVMRGHVQGGRCHPRCPAQRCTGGHAATVRHVRSETRQRGYA